jgi:predicted thioesterase
MISKFQPGDKKQYYKKVKQDDVAAFDSGEVHPVYSTFALARDVEWAGRLFVLEMKEDDEEGIGTSLSIEHRAPAFVGEEVSIESSVLSINKNEIICKYEVYVGDRLVARGTQGQKILKKAVLEEKFDQLK